MAKTFDATWVRSQFPAMDPRRRVPPEIYFDGPGGTQVPRQVIDAVSGYLACSNANLHGAFRTSRESDYVVAGAHRAAADLLGCTPAEVIFGQNMTTLTFWLSRAVGEQLSPGDEIVVTRLDHDANYTPWKSLERVGVRVRDVRVQRKDCTIEMSSVRAKMNRRTKLLAVGFASNAVGSLNDVAKLTRLARRYSARVFVDAVHYAPHGPIDVREIGCDFMACSAYKFFGPHLGLLYGKRYQLQRLPAYQVRPAGNRIPWCHETGTQNHEGMAGLTAAVEYLAMVGRRFGTVGPNCTRREAIVAGMNAIRYYERGLCQRLIRGLLENPDVDLYGIKDDTAFDRRVPTVAIRVRGVSPRRTAEVLAAHRIFVWDGNFYAQNLTEDLGLEESGGLVRIGLAHYNTMAEVDRLLEVLQTLRTIAER